MQRLSSKAANTLQNRYKYNGGNELQSAEFSDGNGLEMYDAVNRMYDPQIGRFWQIDELTESNWECSPYFFANNSPILFNDPFGLDPETSTPEKPKQLQEIVIISTKKMSYWAKMNLMYDLQKRTNGDLNRIVSPDLRYEMLRLQDHSNFRQRVADMTRESDKVVLEAASWAIPTSWILKLKYVRLAAKLLQFKKGEKAAFSIYSHITKKIADQMTKRGWTKEAIHSLVNNPHTTRESVNLATGNASTAFFTKEGAYVVKDNVTKEIIQISNKLDPDWIPDKNIIDPFIPK
jgi:RHS repeat-associated protein